MIGILRYVASLTPIISYRHNIVENQRRFYCIIDISLPLTEIHKTIQFIRDHKSSFYGIVCICLEGLYMFQAIHLNHVGRVGFELQTNRNEGHQSW